MTPALPPRPALPIRVRHGNTIYVPPSLRVTTTYVLLEQEAWFEDEVDFVRTYLRPGDRAIDVGANFGVYTTAMADVVGADGKIFAFEPASDTAAFLRATAHLAHSNQVEVVQAAVSDQAGHALLRLGATPEENALTRTNAPSPRTESVDMLTLDEFLARREEGRIALIKMDAEGHEVQVGHGARIVITRDEPLLLFEIRQDAAIDFGFLEFAESLEFSAYRLAPGLNILVPFHRNQPMDHGQLNLFACSKRKAAELQSRGLLALPSDGERASAPAHQPPPSLFSFGAFPPKSTVYAAVFSHFAIATAKDGTPNQRLNHMLQALYFARQAIAEKDSLSRRVTLARIVADLGYRMVATRILRDAISILSPKQFALPEEPCLRPSRENPSSEPESSSELFRIDVLETYERLRAFSSRFSDVKTLPYIELICDHPLSTAEMHRRRQLLRLHHGLQLKPEPEPKLIQESPGNLNAWFWRR